MATVEVGAIRWVVAVAPEVIYIETVSSHGPGPRSSRRGSMTATSQTPGTVRITRREQFGEPELMPVEGG